jgi:hypothetical protein
MMTTTTTDVKKGREEEKRDDEIYEARIYDEATGWSRVEVVGGDGAGWRTLLRLRDLRRGKASQWSSILRVHEQPRSFVAGRTSFFQKPGSSRGGDLLVQPDPAAGKS